MLKKKGEVVIHDGIALQGALHDSIKALPSGGYNFIIYDGKKNRPLPQLKYLFGVVLKTISENLPDHPNVDALYRYFEEVYAPMHTAYIDGEKFEYFDLKNEKSIEMDDVIERIIHHAKTQWNITIPDRDKMMAPEAKEIYADAYIEDWKNHTQK